MTKKTQQSVNDKLKSKLKREGKSKNRHPSDLRRYKAFDLLLARANKNAPGLFILKGGYLMELRISSKRTTKDIDFLIQRGSAASFNELAKSVVRCLSDAVEENLDDEDSLFSFIFGEPSKEIDGGGGGLRVPAKLMLGTSVFEEFHIDITAEIIVDKLSKIKVEDVMRDEIEHEINAISPEYHFADKIHAYTRPRTNSNSRVKDLIDMYYLVKSGLNDNDVKSVIASVFEKWKTHEIPTHLSEPPAEWARLFNEIASEMGLSQDIVAVFNLVSEYYESLRF